MQRRSLADVMAALETCGTEYIVYDRIEENPSIATVMDAAGIGREQGADFVIGVGGGSPLDAAKAIAMMIHNRDTSSEVLYQKITLRALPVVAVPTTCGTGSEVTPYAILTRDDIQTKQSIPHKIFHAGEYSRMLCMTGFEVWGGCKNVLLGMDPEEEDYENMMLASSLAGMAIAHTGTSLPHGMSYYLTYHKGIPHGKAVGYFLPGYLRLFAEQMDVEVMMILRSLGIGSLEQFEGLIRECLGTPEITDAEKEAILKEITSSERKLAAVPIPVTREQIAEMITN